ncbi:hypothetical protein C7N43_38305 [Sphingobacteriales bacterium UPWRP_1]|nr:hypothetical protein C7N43_38305 [Sphingobacteriales bacterium UPWRP_1]
MKNLTEIVKSNIDLITEKFSLRDENRNGKKAYQAPSVWCKHDKERLYIPLNAWKNESDYIDLKEGVAYGERAEEALAFIISLQKGAAVTNPLNFLEFEMEFSQEASEIIEDDGRFSSNLADLTVLNEICSHLTAASNGNTFQVFYHYYKWFVVELNVDGKALVQYEPQMPKRIVGNIYKVKLQVRYPLSA